MRVAFLLTSFPTITETFVLDQITGLIDLGCEVEIFAASPETELAVHPEVGRYGLMNLRCLPRTPEAYSRRPFRAIHLAAAHYRNLGWPHVQSLNFLRHGRRAASLSLFFEALAYADRPPFDVIHCHFGPNGLRGLALRDIGTLRGKLVTSFYGYDVSEYPRQRGCSPYTQLFAIGDLFLAVSMDMRRKLIESGCNPHRIMVHPLGVNPRMYAFEGTVAQGRPTRILSIGRMVPKKGIKYGLKAVAALAREEPNIEYVIIGDGPLRREIESMVENLGLGGIVRLAGWKSRPEIIKALADTDILLAPSVTADSGDQEGTPVVIMEALASAVPVVSSIHAGIPEVVHDGFSGFLVPERDVPGIAAALQQLVRRPELRARLGAQGRRFIQDRHDIRILNNRLVGIYREVATAGQIMPP